MAVISHTWHNLVIYLSVLIFRSIDHVNTQFILYLCCIYPPLYFPCICLVYVLLHALYDELIRLTMSAMFVYQWI